MNCLDCDLKIFDEAGHIHGSSLAVDDFLHGIVGKDEPEFALNGPHLVHTLVLDEGLQPGVVGGGEILLDLELDAVPILGEQLSVFNDKVTNVTFQKSDGCQVETVP